jgi:hypothetical protein
MSMIDAVKELYGCVESLVEIIKGIPAEHQPEGMAADMVACEVETALEKWKGLTTSLHFEKVDGEDYQIDAREGCLYIHWNGWTYYIDDSTNEKLMSKWKGDSDVYESTGPIPEDLKFDRLLEDVNCKSEMSPGDLAAPFACPEVAAVTKDWTEEQVKEWFEEHGEEVAMAMQEAGIARIKEKIVNEFIHGHGHKHYGGNGEPQADFMGLP